MVSPGLRSAHLDNDGAASSLFKKNENLQVGLSGGRNVAAMATTHQMGRPPGSQQSNMQDGG